MRAQVLTHPNAGRDNLEASPLPTVHSLLTKTMQHGSALETHYSSHQQHFSLQATPHARAHAHAQTRARW